MTKRVVVAATSIVSLQAASLSLGSLIVKHIWLAPALYLVVIIPLPVCFYILRFNTRFRLPFFARKSE